MRTLKCSTHLHATTVVDSIQSTLMRTRPRTEPRARLHAIVCGTAPNVHYDWVSELNDYYVFNASRVFFPNPEPNFFRWFFQFLILFWCSHSTLFFTADTKVYELSNFWSLANISWKVQSQSVVANVTRVVYTSKLSSSWGWPRPTCITSLPLVNGVTPPRIPVTFTYFRWLYSVCHGWAPIAIYRK